MYEKNSQIVALHPDCSRHTHLGFPLISQHDENVHDQQNTRENHERTKDQEQHGEIFASIFCRLDHSNFNRSDIESSRIQISLEIRPLLDICKCDIKHRGIHQTWADNDDHTSGTVATSCEKFGIGNGHQTKCHVRKGWLTGRRWKAQCSIIDNHPFTFPLPSNCWQVTSQSNRITFTQGQRFPCPIRHMDGSALNDRETHHIATLTTDYGQRNAID